MIYLIAVYIVFFCFITYGLVKAPVGWEDEKGFHKNGMLEEK